MKKSYIIGGVIAAVILVGGGWLIAKNMSDKNPAPTQSTTSTPSSSSTSTNSSSTDKTTAATITYTDNGFSPATLTVKAGTTVTIKNNSSQPVQFDSDPHPIHTDDPQLNVGEIAPGQSGSFTPTTTGTHGYHNHLNSSQTGTLIVN